jgi:cytochrome c-type biogenesis protein CcmH
MALWLILALMTAAAVFAVLWPLSRRVPARGGSDIAVYRDQLDEIGRDRAGGLIGTAEAEAAKVEVSRRLLAAADAATAVDKSANVGSSLWRRRATAVAGLVLLPAGAIVLYLSIGSPQLPGEPLAAHIREAHRDSSIANLVSQAEERLEHNPNDLRGYEVLAPVYMQLGRFEDAVTARRKILVIAGENAERQSDLGEALAAAANGIITVDAKRAFERAQALDPNDLKSKFFIGVAAMQDGDRDKAVAIWRGMLAAAPPGAPWAASVQQALAQAGASTPPAASAPGPNAADVAAASQMNEKDRSAMIRGMVAQLAERLQQHGDDIDGWQRLLRAYMVLGERDKAKVAAADARKALGGDPDKLRHIEDVIKNLGIES